MTALRDHLGSLSILLLYLLICFMLTLFVGLGPAVVGAVLAVLAFNYFFVPPIHTFDVAQTDNLVALFVFLGVAVITGRLVASTRDRAEVALREQDRTARRSMNPPRTSCARSARSSAAATRSRT